MIFNSRDSKYRLHHLVSSNEAFFTTKSCMMAGKIVTNFALDNANNPPFKLPRLENVDLC